MIDRDPFSNGTEFDSWMSMNCDRCVKASVMKADGSYTMVRCAIQRDIFARMCSDRPISQRSYDACQQLMCPYRMTEREKRTKKIEGPTLFDNAEEPRVRQLQGTTADNRWPKLDKELYRILERAEHEDKEDSTPSGND